MRMFRPVLLVAGVALLSGCGEGIARHRITEALEGYGVQPGPAACMADHMVDKLSMDQLRKLSVLKGHSHSPIEAVLALQSIDDPQVTRVTVTAAGICLTGIER